jgi:hypothetical protein
VGEGLYAADASRLTYARLRDLAGLVLAAGFPVIVDAACLEAGQRAPFRGLAAERRVPFAILEVTAAPDTLRRRLSHRPREVSDADLAVLEHQLAHWQPLAPAELPHALKVDTEAAPDLPGLAARLRGVPVPVLSR